MDLPQNKQTKKVSTPRVVSIHSLRVHSLLITGPEKMSFVKAPGPTAGVFCATSFQRFGT